MDPSCISMRSPGNDSSHIFSIDFIRIRSEKNPVILTYLVESSVLVLSRMSPTLPRLLLARLRNM